MSMPGQAGTTLIELVIAIVIVSIAVSAVLMVFSMNVGYSADPMIRYQAVAIAEAYLEEISLKAFDDPGGGDGEASRDLYDDADDYHGLVNVGARNQFDAALPGLGDYTVSVTVATSGALPGIAAIDNYLINVTVTHAADINFTLSAYRPNF